MEARSLQIAGASALLKNRDFCRLLAAQFSTVTMVYGLTLAGAVLVEAQTAVVDRWGRKRVLMASHLGRGLVALAFWVGTQLLPLNLALTTVYVVNVAGAISTQFATPAELALLPDLVGPKRLLSANGLFQLSILAAEGLGIIVLSRLLIKAFGVPAVGLVGAGLCFFALALVAALPKDPHLLRSTESGASGLAHLIADLRAGWLTISRDRLLSLVAVQATVAATLLLVLLSLLPGLMSRHLGLAVEDAPLLVLPGGLGFVLGLLLMSRREERLSRPAWIATGLISLGVSIGLLGLQSGEAGRLWLILPLILAIGVALALVIVSARVVLQERPPAAMRGRVIAAQLALANAAAVIPLLIGGSLADHLGIHRVMAFLGLFAVGAGAVGLHYARS
jgi:DHA3 family macrolide efflux protein-like MFS transporter